MPHVTDALVELGLPTALTGGYVRASNVACVGMDHVAIGAAAAEYFLSLGLRTFAFYGKDAAYSKARQDSFVARLKQAGHACHLHRESDEEWENYMEHLRRSDEPLAQWLRELPKPVGIFATHDPMAGHIVQICRSIGLGVPEQVAVLGTNDDEVFCHLANPPLSSVSIPWDRIGGELALALERLMENRQSRKKGSAAPPPIPIPPGPVVTRQSSNLLAVDNPVLLKALRFIQEHLSESLTVKDLLRVVPMSRRRLEVEFRRCLGRTPKDEILRMRIENAKRLLAQTDLQMPLVAERSGFAYTERFSTVFKRKTGTTPTAYRREHRLRA
jgi:LacI family transcriptional regulator